MKLRVLTTVAAAAVLAASLSACQKKEEAANAGNTAEATAPAENTAVAPIGNEMAGNTAGNIEAGNAAMAGNATGNAQ